MAIERIDIGKPPSAIKKLMECLQALGLSPDTFNGGKSVLVFGRRRDMGLAVQVRYVVGTSPTGKPSAKFVEAKVLDPIGIPVSLDVDYDYNKAELKNYGYPIEYAKKLANARKLEYNGGQWIRNVVEFSTATALNEWLDDYLDLLKIDHKRQSPAKRVKPTDLDLMMGEQWVG